MIDSTFHNEISGDGVLTPSEKRVWMERNIGIYFDNEIEPAELYNFKPGKVLYPGDICEALQTPSRIMCNLLWTNLPVDKLRNELGGEINVLDIGCGSGRYFNILDKIFFGITSYTGVEVKRHRKFMLDNEKRAKLVFSPAEKISANMIKEHNLIISQSVLEHVPSELEALRNIANALREKNQPTIQIHILPPPLMFRQYGPHGYRSFNGRSLQTIIDLFSDFSHTVTYTLGGPACCHLHFKYHFDVFDDTVVGRFKREQDDYIKEMKSAIKTDTEKSYINIKDAAFLALVIHSCPSSKIFDKNSFER